jgi:hypothetical protein
MEARKSLAATCAGRLQKNQRLNSCSLASESISQEAGSAVGTFAGACRTSLRGRTDGQLTIRRRRLVAAKGFERRAKFF